MLSQRLHEQLGGGGVGGQGLGGEEEADGVDGYL